MWLRGRPSPPPPLKPKDVEGTLAETNTIAHAKAKGTEKFMITGEELQETIDEAEGSPVGSCKPKNTKEVLAELNTIAHAEMKMTEKINEEEFLRTMKSTDEEVQETADEADRDGNGEADEEMFMRIMSSWSA